MIAARMNVSLAADAAERDVRRANNGRRFHRRRRRYVPRRVNRDAVNRYRSIFADADIASAVRRLNVAALMQPHKLGARFIADPQPIVFVRRYGFRQ